MEGIKLIQEDPNNWYGWDTIEILKMNFDGEYGVLVLLNDERIDCLTIKDFKEVIGYYKIDKSWLRDRKLSSIGI